MLVEDSTETFVAGVPPTTTVAPFKKLRPVIVMVLPPDAKPLEAERLVATGARVNVNVTVLETET
jgi:hypothetical protein